MGYGMMLPLLPFYVQRQAGGAAAAGLAGSLYSLMQLFSGVGSIGGPAASGGVAFWAHVIGFAMGIAGGGYWRVREAATRGYWA